MFNRTRVATHMADVHQAFVDWLLRQAEPQMKHIQKQRKDYPLNIDLFYKVPFSMFKSKVQIPSCIDLWAMYHFCTGFWAMALHGFRNRSHSPVLWWTLARHWSMSLQSLWEDSPQGEDTQSLELQRPSIPFIPQLRRCPFQTTLWASLWGTF